MAENASFNVTRASLNQLKHCSLRRANNGVKLHCRNLFFKSTTMTSKHLKGQLDPTVSDGNVFAPKEVSWSPLSVT